MSDNLDKIDFYSEKSDKFFNAGNIKLGRSYLQDSIGSFLKGLYLKEYIFEDEKGKTYSTLISKNPIFFNNCCLLVCSLCFRNSCIE